MSETITFEMLNNTAFWNSLSPVKQELVRYVYKRSGMANDGLDADERALYRKIVERYEKEVIEPSEKLRQEMQAQYGPKVERLLIADLLDAMDTVINWYRPERGLVLPMPAHYMDALIKARNAANAYWYGKGREKR